MALIPGSTTVTGFVAPTDTADKYPAIDPRWGIDGLTNWTDLNDILNIPRLRRRVGMICGVVDNYVSGSTSGKTTYYGLINNPMGDVTTIDDWLKLNISEVNNEMFKYLLQQTDTQIMWGGDAQIWSDGDENPIVFEVKSQDEHIVDLYNSITGLTETVNHIGDVYYHTYDELKTMRDNDTLVAGRKYGITDFQTIHVIPYTTTVNTGPIEVLVLTADNVNSFNQHAISLSYRYDDLIYDFNNDMCEDGVTPRPGKIIYRYDTQNNVSTYYDYRVVKFRRWKLIPVHYNNSTTYTKNFMVQDSSRYYVSVRDDNVGNALNDDNWWVEINNKNYYMWRPNIPSNFSNIDPASFTLTNIGDRRTFSNLNTTKNVRINKSNQEYNNIVFLYESHDFILYNSYNITAERFYNNGVISNMYNNTFMNVRETNFSPMNHDNIFTHVYYLNMGVNTYGNFISYAVSSYLSGGFYNNTIYSMQGVKTDNSFRWNISGNMVNCSFASASDNNLFIGATYSLVCDNLQSNEFIDVKYVTFKGTTRHNYFVSVEYSSFDDNCHDNVIDGTRFTYIRRDNKIGKNFNNNNIHHNFTNNIIDGEFYRNTITNSFSYNSLGFKIFHDNSFVTFSNNQCHGNMSNNIFGPDVVNNVFGVFDDNITHTSFKNNNLNKSFVQGNYLDDFNDNIITNNFQSNTIGSGFQNNVIEKQFNNNLIGGGFQFNTVKTQINSVDYTSASHVYGNYSCEISMGNAGGRYLTYIQDIPLEQKIVLHTT